MDRGSTRVPVRGFELPRNVVQGGAQVVDDIPDQRTPLWRDGPGDARTPDPFARLRIILNDNAVWIEVEKVLGLRNEVPELLFGPLDLDPAAREVWWHVS